LAISEESPAQCPLSGVERTTIGGELHLRLCRNGFLKLSALFG
jgi:hypothetical protein